MKGPSSVMRGPSSRRDAPTPDDPRDWRPMRPAVTRRPAPITDAIIEPLWSGTRVIAHLGPEAPAGDRDVRFMDDLGSDLAAELPDLATRLGAALLAEEAIIDGLVSVQAHLGGEGTAVITEAWLSGGRLLLSSDAGIEVKRRAGTDALATDALAPDAGGFICLDLLALDGAPLLDVPLLERKRLLESVVAVSGHVLVSVHTRPPVDTWVATWKSLGLRGAMLKAANSRYLPGQRTLEWRAVERIASRR